MQMYPNPKPQPVNEPLAVAYVKNQSSGSKTYDIQTALIKGTIYPSLDKPFIGKGGR